MEKLRRISTIIDKILMVVYRLLIIVSTTAFVAVMVLNLVSYFTNSPMEGSWTLSLGNVDLELAEHAMQNEHALPIEMFCMVLSMIILAFFTCYGIKLLRNILAPMIEGKPFAGTVSANLNKLGWVIIVSGIALDITECIATKLIYSAFDLTNLLLSDKITDITVNYTVGSFSTLVIGMLVFLLSHVFRYGEQLQQQDDETL